MAKQYELECGHCGYLFTLEGEIRTRSVKCEVCGGALTVAVAIPTEPEKPPAPPPPPASPPPPRKPLVPTEPDRRAIFLRAPWSDAYQAINALRIAASLTWHFSILYAGLTLFLLPITPVAERGEVENILSWAAIVFLLSAAFHVVNQLPCTSIPRSHGGAWAIASVMVLWLVGAVMVGFVRSDRATAFVLSGALCAGSFGLWLYFLARLGQRLGDPELRTAAQSFITRYWVGLVLAAAFGTGALMAAQARSEVLAWCGQSLAFGIGLVLLRRYANLLGVASLALARRGPVISDS